MFLACRLAWEHRDIQQQNPQVPDDSFALGGSCHGLDSLSLRAICNSLEGIQKNTSVPSFAARSVATIQAIDRLKLQHRAFKVLHEAEPARRAQKCAGKEYAE